ncbi:uncharacterized protein SAPINGB_P002828 [Magnusiomyces paraingens]|uniref:Amino acid permease/ SLC12A domain-containing protein n=1 Tax=Magnusiomyces paraingens TaxID=2606893 RepID=A0A5E8BHE4_9ASCO|nr:uncharacterized protein SAPINGB_P002828 [Saprochaete ingens]VVT50631.1 unnamed protein product [Saprochaete ingens]
MGFPEFLKHKKSEEVTTTDVESASIASKGHEIGIFSAIFLIFNRMVGTGIFATPSTIYSLSGSVGGALMMWFAGSIIAASGMLVYLEWGTAIPRNGGEKNYLDYFYRKPRMLALSMFGFYALLLGWAASNSVVFGEYILTAAGQEVTRWNQRGIGLACISFCLIVHSLNVRLGLWIQNSLGIFKLAVVIVIMISGWVGLAGKLKSPKTDNFDNAFSGHTPTGYGVVMALYNVIWSYIGYSNANYALGEAKNPVRTLKIAAPLALIGVSILYMFINIAYFAIVPKEEILTSGRILAANYFRLAFGEKAQKALSVFVALSALGNVMSVIFSQGRIVQELGKEGVLPFSRFFGSSKPFGTPMAGLFTHWVVSIIIMLAPPPGDAYNFILNLISYPLSVINSFVALGLIILTIRREHYGWYPPFRATLPVSIFFFLSSLYLVAAPYIPPSAGQSVYNSLPYWLHCVVGTCFFVAGAIYWVIRFRILPKYWPERFSQVPDNYNGYDTDVSQLTPATLSSSAEESKGPVGEVDVDVSNSKSWKFW